MNIEKYFSKFRKFLKNLILKENEFLTKSLLFGGNAVVHPYNENYTINYYRSITILHRSIY